MLDIREVRDIKEAEVLWRAISPSQTIFDDWDFRYTFYKYDSHPILFLAAYENGELIGLLPLQLHPKHGYEFFDEYNCEENRPFIKPGHEAIIPKLYQAIPGKTKIYDISGEDDFTKKLEIEDYSYYLPLSGLKDFSDFLTQRLNSKRRRSLEKEISLAAANNFEVEVFTGENLDKGIKALESLLEFNTGNFKEESYLLKEDQAPWYDLIKLPFNWRWLTVKKDNKIQGVALSVVYNNDWHYLITGVNFKEFPGLGKLMVKEAMEAAIREGAKIFDAGLGDCGWKHLWHFDKKPQYIFTKGD